MDGGIRQTPCGVRVNKCDNPRLKLHLEVSFALIIYIFFCPTMVSGQRVFPCASKFCKARLTRDNSRPKEIRPYIKGNNDYIMACSILLKTIVCFQSQRRCLFPSNHLLGRDKGDRIIHGCSCFCGSLALGQCLTDAKICMIISRNHMIQHSYCCHGWQNKRKKIL